MFSPDIINEIYAEHLHYLMWQREEKNRILKLVNEKKKQEMWKKIFPPSSKPDDSYIFNNPDNLF